MAELKPSAGRSRPAKKVAPKSGTYINNGRSGISLGDGRKLQPGEQVEMTSAEAEPFKGLLDSV